MKNSQISFFWMSFLIVLVAFYTTSAEITVNPFGFAVSVEDEIVEVELILSNDSEDDVAFNIGYYLIDDEEGQIGPRRDDLGDLIDEFEPPQQGNVNRHVNGIAWDSDNEWMWISESDNRRVIAVDPFDDYEMVAQFDMPDGVSGLAYYGGVFYGVGWINHPWLYRTDADGENLGNFQLQASAGACTCGDNGLLFAMASQVIYVYDIEDDYELLGQFRDYEQFLQNQLAQSICWVDEHPDGQLWLNSRTGNGDNNAWEVLVDTDEWEAVELVQQFVSDAEDQQMGHPRDGIGHDGENLWITHWQSPRIRIVDDGIREFSILSIDPESGVIPGEDNESVDIQIVSEGAEPAVYNILLEIAVTELEEDNDDIVPFLIELSAVISVEEPTFDISGVISDLAEEQPVEDVTIDIDRYIITRYSDENGEYSFNDLPLGEYQFTFTAPDFLRCIEHVEVDEGGEIELDIELRHSRCNPDRDEIFAELAPDENIQVNFNVRNDGNGPLTYLVERRLLGDANADPWTLRQSLFVGEDRDDSRIQGVVFANDHFYVTGSHDNEPAIYIFSPGGEYIDMFIQPGEDRYGMKDLAWNDELLWGVIGQTIYGLTLNGDVQVELESPFQSTTNITWDPDNQWLWVSGTTTNFAALDVHGDQQAEVNRQGLRVYGLAYFPDDPDDHPLYIYAKESQTNRAMVYKANPDDGDIVFITYLDTELGGSPQGAFITNQYDIYSWVFIAVANAGANDRVDIWQIEAFKDWMQLDPMEGVIEADNTQEFNLTLDATGLPPEDFWGELVFLHDGVGSETHIPVTLRVVEGPIEAERTIELEIGWNMVSANLQPEPDDIRELMRELVEAELLLLMKDGQGRFYSPEFDFCNIPGWNVADGYQIKMDEAGELTLEGITVMADEPIPLTDGWNMISYYPRTPVDAIVAFSGIEDQLLLAKDGVGRFYNPEWGFSNMGDLQELRGYQVKVTEDLELVYRLHAEDDEFILNVRDRQGRLPVHPLTGNNMSLLVEGGRVQDGEIGVYASGELVGSGVLEDGVCGIAIWGDDHTTQEIDGALEGASLELSLLDENGLHPVQYKTLTGNGLYQTDDFWMIELKDISMIPEVFGITSVYPNPFNSLTHLTFNLPEATHIDLALFNLSGRKVMDIESGQKNAGQYTTTIDGALLSSGVYIVQLKACGHEMRSKITLVK